MADLVVKSPTAASLPCMFSPLGREAHGDLKGRQENLLDVLQRAGLAVLWLDNQSGCKGLCERVPNGFAARLPQGVAPLQASLCHGEECFDEALLHGLDQRIAALDPTGSGQLTDEEAARAGFEASEKARLREVAYWQQQELLIRWLHLTPTKAKHCSVLMPCSHRCLGAFPPLQQSLAIMISMCFSQLGN